MGPVLTPFSSFPPQSCPLLLEAWPATRSLLQIQNLGPAPGLLDPNLHFNDTSKGSVVRRCLRSTGLGLPVPPNPFLPFGPVPPLAAPMAEGGGRTQNLDL